MSSVKSPKKLIEVAMPLDDINLHSAKEKSVRHGHPSNLHRWWARRPLAAARAVIFAQMVIDPSETVQGDRRLRETKLKIQNEREQLFNIIRDLVKWENTHNTELIEKARKIILNSWIHICELNKGDPLFDPDKLPEFHDPFAGGGGMPLEAQRLGLVSNATDLNPVAVLINKAMIEIPPLFSGVKPIGPIPSSQKQSKLLNSWDGPRGLAEDVWRYGNLLRSKAAEKLDRYYAPILIDEEIVRSRHDLQGYLGQRLNVVSWVWARSVKSPSPAYSNVEVPLAKSFVLSRKKGKETYLNVDINGSDYSFNIVRGPISEAAKSGTKLARGANFRCILSGSPIDAKYIKSESKNGRMSHVLMAVVLEGKRERVYLSANDINQSVPDQFGAQWEPNLTISGSTQYVGVAPYGLSSFSELFSPRQLNSLNTICDLITDIREQIIEDGKNIGRPDDNIGLENGGKLLTAYADAICIYLALCVSKLSDSLNTLCPWEPVAECSRQLFNRQAISMAWEYGEGNVLGTSSGSFLANLKVMVNFFGSLPSTSSIPSGHVENKDATTQDTSQYKVVSTDPPYFDNVPYADISDFFYVWLRRSLKDLIPSLFSTMATPKSNELVAFAYRHKNKDAASEFFMDGMTRAMQNLAEKSHPAYPVTIYYAFKQSETDKLGTSSTGWEAFLEAVVRAGFEITGTWPMRTELNAALKTNLNTLASSIILVCRKRRTSKSVSRREFQRELNNEMPTALEEMIGGQNGLSPISPVDLAQSAIGPGMAIYSSYEEVINQDGTKLSVHDALILINRAINEYLNPDSGNFDNDTLFCDDWFGQYGWSQGLYGDAELLALAKGSSVDGVREAGVIESGSGKVRLLKWSEYPADWDPKADTRTPVWEACHHMIRALNQQGEAEAGALLARMPERGENIRQLAYHLYTLCERKKWAEDARAYNELIGSWHAIVAASHEVGHRGTQPELGLDF